MRIQAVSNVPIYYAYVGGFSRRAKNIDNDFHINRCLIHLCKMLHVGQYKPEYA